MRELPWLAANLGWHRFSQVQPIHAPTGSAGRWPATDCCMRLLLVAANLGWRRGSSRRASTHGVELPLVPTAGRQTIIPWACCGRGQPWLAPWFRAESIHAWRGSTAGQPAIGSRQPWLAPPLAAVPSTRLPASGRHYPHFLRTKKKPRCVSSGVLGVNPGDDLLSHGLSHTTIGAAAFHFRVRDGIGWFHSANFTREAFGESHSSRGDKAPASHSSCDVACTWMLLRRCRKAKAT